MAINKEDYINPTTGNVQASDELITDIIDGFNTHLAEYATESNTGHIQIASLLDTLNRVNSSKAVVPSMLNLIFECLQEKQVSRATNFNNVTDSGLYYYNTWGGSGGSNYPPEQGTGFMLVLRESTGQYVMQIAMTDTTISIRRLLQGAWSSWKKTVLRGPKNKKKFKEKRLYISTKEKDELLYLALKQLGLID